MNYEHLCKQAKEIIITVGDFIFQEKNKLRVSQVETKGIHNFVTYVDTTAEQKLVDGLQKLLPEAGFITEEQTNTKVGETFNWIIDPLDGTTNFIHSLPPFAISVALMEEDEIVLGIVYEINLDECFYAWKDSKAYLNGAEITVSSTQTVQDSLIATGFPYYNYDRLLSFMKTLEYFMENSHGIRRIGSAATDLAYVACGRFDAFYEYSLSSWDVAAGSFIVQQAGGKVSDFKGDNNYIFGKEIVAGNSEVFPEFLGIIKNIMK